MAKVQGHTTATWGKYITAVAPPQLRDADGSQGYKRPGFASLLFSRRCLYIFALAGCNESNVKELVPAL